MLPMKMPIVATNHNSATGQRWRELHAATRTVHGRPRWMVGGSVGGVGEAFETKVTGDSFTGAQGSRGSRIRRTRVPYFYATTSVLVLGRRVCRSVALPGQ